MADPTTTRPYPLATPVTWTPSSSGSAPSAPPSRTGTAQALARLMAEREDLQGVHALADLVSDSLRWSA